VAALVDTFDRLDVNSVAAAGVELDRLLWVRGEATSPVDRAIDRALKALNLILQAGRFGIVAIDLADAPPVALRRLPLTTWLRIQRTIEGSETACVIVSAQPLARSAGGVTLVTAGRAEWSRSETFLMGLDMTVRAVSPRRRTDEASTVRAQVHG
jgi:hypothetical protein